MEEQDQDQDQKPAPTYGWFPNFIAVMGMAYGTLFLLLLSAVMLIVSGNSHAAVVMEAAENLALILFGGTATMAKDLIQHRLGNKEKPE